jgi:hypothetical protein
VKIIKQEKIEKGMIVLYSNGVWRLLSMPEISRFFGIIIAMYYKEHAPPHFHVKYGGQRAAFAISDLEIIKRDFSPAEQFLLFWNGRSSTDRN